MKRVVDRIRHNIEEILLRKREQSKSEMKRMILCNKTINAIRIDSVE